MILTNEVQYEVTLERAAGFRDVLEHFDEWNAHRKDAEPWLLQAEREAVASLLETADREIAEYKQLKTAEQPVVQVRRYEELAEGLAAARIASGLSLQALAEKVGLPEQELRSLEEKRYTEATFQQLLRIANCLRVQVECTFTVPRQEAPALAEAEVPEAAEG